MEWKLDRTNSHPRKSFSFKPKKRSLESWFRSIRNWSIRKEEGMRMWKRRDSFRPYLSCLNKHQNKRYSLGQEHPSNKSFYSQLTKMKIPNCISNRSYMKNKFSLNWTPIYNICIISTHCTSIFFTRSINSVEPIFNQKSDVAKKLSKAEQIELLSNMKI